MPVAHLFLAPHFDDVALSCGGTVAGLAAAGEAVAIATVFGGTPPPEMPLTPYARGHLTDWRVGSMTEALRTRRAEDEAAAAVLGAALHILDFVDGPFRDGHYPSWDALRAELVPADAALPGAIADAVRALGVIGPGTTVTGPLAVGRHVDHHAVYAATRLLAADRVRIRGYEDFPYAAQGNERAARLAALGLADEAPEIVSIGPSLETKIRAIACYPSQLPGLFAAGKMPEAVRAYARLVAGGTGAAERYWRLR